MRKILLILILLVTDICTADEIFLIDGSSTKTKIIDTSGCDIKILRNNSNVTIKKKNVEKIIFGKDTILFKNIVCQDTVRPAIPYYETPLYKLKVLIDSLVVDYHDIKDNSKMAYLSIPLDGNYNMEEFTLVQMSAIDLLQKRLTTSLISPDSILQEFNNPKPHFDYVFITLQYHTFEIKSPNRMCGFKPNPADVTTLLCTSCDFVICDMTKKCIIFRYNKIERQAEDMTYKKERISDKNAPSIKKDFHKILTKYLKIYK
jgi:hypothetical protein